MEFWPTHCSIKGQTLLQGDISHGLYRLPPVKTNLTSTMALTGVRTSLHGWHQRLAHPHESLLRHLLSSFQLPISTNKFPNVCDSFQLGKSHHFPLPTSHVASTKPFDLMYFFQLMEIVILFYLLMIALSLCGFIFFLKNPKFTPCLCNSER